MSFDIFVGIMVEGPGGVKQQQHICIHNCMLHNIIGIGQNIIGSPH